MRGEVEETREKGIQGKVDRSYEPLTFPISSAPVKDPISQPIKWVGQKLKQVGQNDYGFTGFLL